MENTLYGTEMHGLVSSIDVEVLDLNSIFMLMVWSIHGILFFKTGMLLLFIM